MASVVVGRRCFLIIGRKFGRAQEMAAMAAAARDRGEVVVTLSSAPRRAPPIPREIRKMSAAPAGDCRAWVAMNQPRGVHGRR